MSGNYYFTIFTIMNVLAWHIFTYSGNIYFFILKGYCSSFYISDGKSLIKAPIKCFLINEFASIGTLLL